MNNSEFIKLLQDSVGDGEKISRVLAISNIQEIKNFLISLGVKPEHTELAGFVELTRSSLSTILLNNNTQISEKEISYGDNQKVYVDEKGVFHLSDNKTLEEQPNGYIHYYENGSILFEKHVINEYGAVIYSSTAGNPPFSGEYTIIERRMGDNLPTVYVESTDGASYGISDTSIDFGHPTNPTSKHTEFQDNYYTYCKHYPKLKEWYASRFPMKDKDEFACTEVLNNAQFELEIDKLEKEIESYSRSITTKESENAEQEQKLGELLSYIKGFGKRTGIGKRIGNRILEKVSQIKRPAPYTEPDQLQEENQNDEEVSLFKRKENLERKLSILKEKYSVVSAESLSLKEQINTIQEELNNIPVVGRMIYKSASRPSKKTSSPDGR